MWSTCVSSLSGLSGGRRGEIWRLNCCIREASPGTTTGPASPVAGEGGGGEEGGGEGGGGEGGWGGRN